MAKSQHYERMLNNSICPSFVLRWTQVHLVRSGTELLKCWKLQGGAFVDQTCLDWDIESLQSKPKTEKKKRISFALHKLWPVYQRVCIIYSRADVCSSSLQMLLSCNLDMQPCSKPPEAELFPYACQSVCQRPGALLNSQVRKKYVLVCLVSMALASPVQSLFQGTHGRSTIVLRLERGVLDDVISQLKPLPEFQ